MADADIDFDEIRSRLNGSQVERTQALKDIKSLVKTYGARQANVPRKEWNYLLVDLTRLAAKEQAAYLKQSKGVGIAIQRLTAYSEALRHVAEACTGTIRAKSVNVLIDHITSMLPSTHGRFDKISVEYIKTLGVVLEYQPHVEHLRKPVWIQVLTFCVQRLKSFQEESSGDSDGGISLPSRSASRLNRATAVAGRSLQPVQPHNEGSELVLCIRHLCRAPNAPVLEGSYATVDVLVEYLSKTSSTGRADIEALSAINSVVTRAISSSIGVVEHVVETLLPHLANLWSLRSATLRDEILTFLNVSLAHITRGVRNDPLSETRECVERIFDVLRDDYSTRLVRDQLRLDDLELGLRQESIPAPFHPDVYGFRLARGNIDGESKWMTMYAMSSFASILDETAGAQQPEQPDDAPRKRRRVSSQLENLLSSPWSGAASGQLCRLQILAFMITGRALSADQHRAVMDTTIGIIANSSHDMSSWAMLVLANCSLCKCTTDPSLGDAWLRVWESTHRAIPSQHTSRAACHLLSLMLQFKLIPLDAATPFLGNMLRYSELNGPAVLCESSISLWMLSIRTLISVNPSGASGMMEKLLRWIFNKWTPGSFDDRLYVSQASTCLRIPELLRILSFAARGRYLPSWIQQQPLPCGVLAHAWRRVQETSDLANYLLLLSPDRGRFVHEFETQASDRSFNVRPDRSSHALIVEYCISESEKALQKLEDRNKERLQSLAPSVLRLISGLGLVSNFVLSIPGELRSTRSMELSAISGQLRDALFQYLSRPDCDQDQVDAVYREVSALLPDMNQVHSIIESPEAQLGFTFVSEFSKVANSRRSRSKFTASDRNGAMDLDDGFDAQLSQSSTRHVSVTGDRDWYSVVSGIESFRSCVDNIAYYMSCMAHHAKPDTAGDEISESFVQYLVDLESLQLLYGSGAVSHILGATQIPDSGLLSLLERMAEILTDYDLGHHEVWLQACLAMLGRYSSHWVNNQQDDLGATGREMYGWFLNVAFAQDALSPRIEVAVLDLLFTLLAIGGPDLAPLSGAGDDNESVRTSILNSIDRGVVTNYHLADKLPILFRHFTLGNHSEVFGDIFERLALEAENPENMAVRMVMFSRLASSWHTLLRRCVYHIFEAAARLPTSQEHAAYCFGGISKSLGLGSEKELFALFSSQLLYTWLSENKQPIESIPFSVFRYSTLKDLLRDVEDEAFAQAMTMSDNSSKTLAKLAHRDFSKMLVDGFAKVAAYSFSEDAQRPPRAGAKAGGGKIKYLSNIFGVDKFPKLLFRHYSRILGIFIATTRVEEDSVLQSILSKESTTKSAAAAFTDIRKRSASTIELPPEQQPTFSAASLHEKVDRLCRRMGMPYESLWTPAMYVFVLRYLLQKIHPSLGSLHACSVLRKIRLFVVLSGDVPLSGYPLEMTLLALQPFLTIQQCADDAIGICQYLLEKGGNFLLYRLPFVAGFTLSSLISLRAFAASSHDSTTQENDYRATVSRADAFRDWLFNTWLHDYSKSKTGDDDAHTRFRALVGYAYQTQNSGNGITSTPESQLLQGILEDRSEKSPLLEEQVSRNIITLLCAEFNQPPSYREDILGDDVESAKFANRIWRSVHTSPTLGDGYLVWAGKVLGRAQFSGAWEGVSKLMPEQPDDFASIEENDDEEDLTHQSLSLIIRSASEILHRSSRIEVGLAEDSFRQILTGSSKSRQKFSEALIPSYLETALRLETADAVMIMPTVNVPTLGDSLSATECDVTKWTQNIAMSLAEVSGNNFLLSIRPLLQGVHSFAEKTLAPLLHIFLVEDSKKPVENQKMSLISKSFQSIFESLREDTVPHARAILNCILYLRGHDWIHGTTVQDRQKWLDLNYIIASRAAEACGMHTTALLLAETSASSNNGSESQSGRRRTTEIVQVLPEDLLLSIYRSIDEPDSFYGVHQSTSLATVLERLDYENDGFNSLLFHGARLDSDMRVSQKQEFQTSSVLKALTRLNLNGVAHILLQSGNAIAGGDSTLDQTLETSRRLEQWDISVPDLASSHTATLFRVFQDLHNSTKGTELRVKVDDAIQSIVRSAVQANTNSRDFQAARQTLGALCEIDELLSSVSSEQFDATWRRMRDRNAALEYEGLESLELVLSSRQNLFNIISGNKSLQKLLRITERSAKSAQLECLLDACKMALRQNSTTDSLSSVTYLSDLVPACRAVGLDVDIRVQEVTADILWAQGEQQTAIRILHALDGRRAKSSGSKSSAKPTILAKLGHHIGEARLENPEEIIRNYLEPALQALKGHTMGPEAGQVLHTFAVFCDKQLHNPDFIEEFDRASKAHERWEREVDAYQNVLKSSRKGRAQNHLLRDYEAAQKWFDLNNREYQRYVSARESLIVQCLENYLRSLAAWDQHDSDALRLFSIWLEWAEKSAANTVVSKQIGQVPSAKFAILMNQLTSILQNDTSTFQLTLKVLIARICVDHPFQTLHHIFGAVHGHNAAAGPPSSRSLAIRSIAESFKKDKVALDRWHRVYKANSMYHDLARYRDKYITAGRELTLENIPPSAKLIGRIKDLKVPPATLRIPLQRDRDYKSVPKVVSFLSKMSIATGVSAPKILTAIGTDGQKYKQLFKGGNDDLRQDAIMEQVFDQVSQLLKNHSTTRKRRLHIRTYQVLPLTTSSGIIEFVQNTIPLQSYLAPAHQLYHPMDYTFNECRQKLHDIARQTKDPNSILTVFRSVTKRYRPVLRFFFLERFLDPDEWFSRRLAYTRTTAAISILGHVLGLGDRHCSNILLDQKTGEAVHIDLGIAFEAGRVLPVPEVVPFRLSRDIVDAMGYTKTEGVFRRCCEFTLDALREDRESIMTLLNVLKYDPLVNWTVSPLRAKRMQEQEASSKPVEISEAHSPGPGGLNKSEEGQAETALGVVEKKLSKVLSTAATVSELIQQATDERNLAVLFPGWSSFS